MKRMMLCVGVCLISSAVPSWAQDQTPQETIVTRLEAQGYTDIQISRTFLGRIQIEAILGQIEREIILNARTGEILRDYEETLDEDDEEGGEDNADDDHEDEDGEHDD